MPDEYEYSIDQIFDPSSPFFSGAVQLDTPTSARNVFTDGVGANSIETSETTAILYYGKLDFDNTAAGYRLGVDFDKVAKFFIGNTTQYLNWDGTTLTIAGGLSASSGTIGGFDIGADYVRDAANSMGLASTVTGGDDVRFWAGDTFANRATAPFRVTEAGAVSASSITITGGSINSTPISGIPNDTNTDISLLEKTHNLVFSATDADTIAWGSGTITLSNGRTFAISAGNTGNMAAFTYIYLDPAVSSTVLQTTTTATTAMGANKVLLGTAQNHTVTASFIPYGPGVPLIDGSNIGALSIVAGNIAASAITATKISVSQLSAITADMGALTAGTITLDTAGYVRGGATDYLTGTGFFLGYSGSAYKFSVGNPAGNYISWDGTTLTIIGNQVVVDTFNADGTWTKPTGAKSVVVQAWGGGGGGGSTAGGANTSSAGGGGGGGYTTNTFNAADLTSTVAVTVPAAATAGNAGGTVLFGSYLSAFGGGAGVNSANNQASGGGGGAGISATGSNSVSTGTGTGMGGAGGGLVGSAVGADNGAFGGAGGADVSSADGGNAVYGGGGGGAATNTPAASGGDGGSSIYGGGGGGAGCFSGSNSVGGTSKFGGAGGAGTVDGNGVNGTAPGGGGGGGGENTGSAARTGGSGGAGRIVVTTYL